MGALLQKQRGTDEAKRILNIRSQLHEKQSSMGTRPSRELGWSHYSGRRRRWGPYTHHHHSPHHHSPHIHWPHAHLPHVHWPHGHLPHSHSPHRHNPHCHNPHTHSPHCHWPHVHGPGEVLANFVTSRVAQDPSHAYGNNSKCVPGNTHDECKIYGYDLNAMASGSAIQRQGSKDGDALDAFVDVLQVVGGKVADYAHRAANWIMGLFSDNVCIQYSYPADEYNEMKAWTKIKANPNFDESIPVGYPLLMDANTPTFVQRKPVRP